MSELVIEVGYQVSPNAAYIRASGDEIHVTVHPFPAAEVLAALRDDIVDTIGHIGNLKSESPDDSDDATRNVEFNPTGVWKRTSPR